MSKLWLLPENITETSVIGFYDNGTGTYVLMTVADMIAKLRTINPDFNIFIAQQMPYSEDNYRFSVVRAYAVTFTQTPKIADENYITGWNTYVAGVKSTPAISLDAVSSCYKLSNNSFIEAGGSNIALIGRTVDGDVYGCYGLSQKPHPIVIVDSNDVYINNVYHAGYTWNAWDQLSGNNGQYRADLTMVKNGVVDELSGHYQRGASYFDRISRQSSIFSIIQNSSLDTERTIAYSGNNTLTLTVSAGTQNVSRKLTYKFYVEGNSVPLVTQEQIIYLAGNSPTADVLLMFVHDDENQVAAFLPVEKVYYQGGLEQFIFGDVSPSADDMLYLWLWLQMSGAGEPEYPYDTGSTDNGGDPTGNIGGDHIQTPPLPTLGGMSSGFFTVYCPTEQQLAAIAQYLWTDSVITNIRKYFTNFSDNIIALYVLPYKSASLPFKNFKVGNMEAQDITNVEYVTARFVDIDMGSVYVENEYDSYLDYSPYTKFDCFLPAIGVVSLDADDIMCVTDPDTGVLSSVKGSTVSLKYTLDLMTGVVVAFITINGEMRYQFSGKVGYNIPLTGENYSGMATGFVTAVAGLVGTIATGGMTAPMSASAAVAGTISAMKPEIHRGGNLTGDASLLGGRTPYLIYRRPNKPLLEKQGIFTGFPSYKSGKLTDFTGYTEVIDAHVEGISCTETERAEILTLLKSGVII